jgi:hypothetical protein
MMATETAKDLDIQAPRGFRLSLGMMKHTKLTPPSQCPKPIKRTRERSTEGRGKALAGGHGVCLQEGESYYPDESRVFVTGLTLAMSRGVHALAHATR